MKIASIGFKRQNPMDGFEWKPIGFVWYESKTHQCKIWLGGWVFGDCYARPSIDTPPFLRGEILCPMELKAESVIRQFVGRISSHNKEPSNDPFYSIDLECLPMCPMSYGIWLPVTLDDADSYSENNKNWCPF